MPMDNSRSNLLYLWPRRTLFVGRLRQPIAFSQAAASLVIGVEGPVQLVLPGSDVVWHEHSLLLAPGQSARIDPQGQLVAACYLDALGQDFRLLSHSMARHQDGVYAGFHGEHSLQRWLKALYNVPMQAEEAFDALESGINPAAESYPETDPRVARVVERIQSEIGRNVSVEELANSVNLSVSRLVELFRAQVGVPVRRYRQWHRLFVTFTGVERGTSLTDAAIAAGFADSAHFSHTFRMTLGMTPSDIVTMLSGSIFVGHGAPVGGLAGHNAGAGLPTPTCQTGH